MIGLILALATADAHIPVLFFVGPDDDWCRTINEVIYPGDVVLLAGGTYVGPCAITLRQTDLPGEVTIVQSIDAQDPARFVSADPAEPALTITGTLGFLLNVSFDAPASGHGLGLRLRDIDRFFARNNTFVGPRLDGLEIAGTSWGLRVDGNVFTDVGTAMRIGCDGCDVADLTVDVNLVHGAAVGAVIEQVGAPFKFLDNVIIDAELGVSVNVVESTTLRDNLVVADGTAAQLDGPVTLVNHVLHSRQGSAVLASGVGAALFGATVIADIGPAIVANAPVHSYALAVVGGVEGALSPGAAVLCADAAACFRDAASFDYYPVAGGPLDGTGAPASVLDVDFCGRPRGTSPSAGALQAAPTGLDSPAPFTVAPKDRFDCSPYRTPLDPQEPTDTGEAPIPEPEVPTTEGCGCAAIGGGRGGPTLWWVLVALAGWRAKNQGRPLTRRTALSAHRGQ